MIMFDLLAEQPARVGDGLLGGRRYRSALGRKRGLKKKESGGETLSGAVRARKVAKARPDESVSW